MLCPLPNYISHTLSLQHHTAALWVQVSILLLVLLDCSGPVQFQRLGACHPGVSAKEVVEQTQR